MDKSTDDMIKEVWTVLLGVSGTEAGGMVQDVRDIAKGLKILNGYVQKNTAWRKAISWVVGLIITFLCTWMVYMSLAV